MAQSRSNANKAESIDRVAGGLLRHRFVRALGASWLVLYAVGIVVLCAFALQDSRPADTGRLEYALMSPFLFLIVLVLLLLPTAFSAAAIGAALDSLHRRVVAFFGVAALGLTILFLAFGGLGILGEVVGVIPAGDNPVAGTSLQAWGFVGFVLVALVIALECLGWAWWQLTVSREGFLAARGWRPPPTRLWSTLRRQLGLPAFISNFGRGRLGLTLLYFAVAVLNSGIVAIIIIPFLVFTENTPEEQIVVNGIAIALGVLLLLNILGAGRIFDAIADRRATRLYQDVREWDPRAPIVFLRTFDQDDAKLVAETRDPLVKFPAGVGEPRTLDEILLESASPHGPVIAIGDPRDPTPPLGAARIFVPGEDLGWRNVVSGLVGAARAVIMCPNDTEGVKWELELIARAEGRIRTIYLSNPEIPVETTAALFERLAPPGAARDVARGQRPIAAFLDQAKGWRVLSARSQNLQSTSVALNIALRAILGEAAPPAMKAPKRRKQKPA